MVTSAKVGSRVLVIDNDENVREFIELALGDEGCSVVSVPNGAAALQIAGHVQPTLILLDLAMPVMDGWEFVRVYRAGPGPHAPIVVFTAAHDVAEYAERLEAAAYLPKPFALDDLLDIVGRFTACD